MRCNYGRCNEAQNTIFRVLPTKQGSLSFHVSNHTAQIVAVIMPATAPCVRRPHKKPIKTTESDKADKVAATKKR